MHDNLDDQALVTHNVIISDDRDTFAFCRIQTAPLMTVHTVIERLTVEVFLRVQRNNPFAPLGYRCEMAHSAAASRDLGELFPWL